MSSRHLRQEPQDRQFKRVFIVVTVAVAFVAVASAAVVYFLGSSAPNGQGRPDAAPQPVTQQGTLVAVTPDSLTARSSDGFARTYQINAQTTAITGGGSRVGNAGSSFVVNDQVSILAVIRDGRAVATTVAGQAASDLNGPPMDDVAALPATP